MVQCCNNTCPAGWFHLECVGLDQAPEGNWYCGEDCRKSDGYIFCTCKRRRGQADHTMLHCALGNQCLKHEFYHRKCIGATPQDVIGIPTHLFLILLPLLSYLNNES